MKHLAVSILFFSIVNTGCSNSGLKTVQKTEQIMGTEVTITVVAKSRAEGAAAIEQGMAEIRRLDRMMSLYRDDSQVTKVNLAAGSRPVKVSPEMIEVAEAAARISALTEGAFDVTVGPLVVLWQMRLKEGRVPADEEIARVRQRVNYRNIVIDRKEGTLFLRKPNMVMDFGGVAKGYAADRAVDVLRKKGINDAIIAIAGDIRLIGRRADGKPWRVGVQHPREKGKTLAVLDLTDTYISTSGDYERYTIVQKKRYHHIIDPRTGRPARGMQTVTVVADRGEVGDPLTTALFILGPDHGMQILKASGYEAIMGDASGRVIMTDGIRIMEEGATAR